MKKLFIIVCLIISSLHFAFSQVANQKIMYVIDEIPFDQKRDGNLGGVLNEYIFEQRTITNKDSLTKLGYAAYNSVTYVTTKKFKSRKPEDLKIPTTRLMVLKSGTWYLPNDKKKYSGRFIDYYLNGNKCAEGELLDGKLNGLIKEYDAYENIKFATNYLNGVKDGSVEEYFVNGKVLSTGFHKNGVRFGQWKFFYSTEKLNYEINYDKPRFTGNIYNPPVNSEGLDSVDKTLNNIRYLIVGEKYAEAMTALNKVITLNPKNNEVYYYRGITNMSIKEYDKALEDFEKALQIEPLYAEALESKAFLLIKKYDWNLFFRHGRFIYEGEGISKIPKEDLTKICGYLNLANSIKNLSAVGMESLEKYCN